MRKVKNLYHLANAVFYSFKYGFPTRRLRIIAVTGTDGKTTTANFIYHMLKTAGRDAALISTISAKVGEAEMDTGLHVTSPDPKELQRLLKMVADRGMEFLVLEITSHGIDQHRVWGINPEITVYTNVTHEHLDYHGDARSDIKVRYENYLNTKAKLINRSKHILLNKYGQGTEKLKEYCEKYSKSYLVYDYKNIQDKVPHNLQEKFPGVYNLENAAGACEAVKLVGILQEEALKALETMPELNGRFNKLVVNKPFDVIVDFAHTPNALKEVLQSAGKVAKKRVIVVFGSAGLRDPLKRPLMGEHAISYADIAILTAEDPRTEKVEDICKQIEEGCKKAGGILNKDYFIIHDRKEAINFAINEVAKEGDLVIITGKGHEQSMCFGTEEKPWSDKEAVLEILAKSNV